MTEKLEEEKYPGPALAWKIRRLDKMVGGILQTKGGSDCAECQEKIKKFSKEGSVLCNEIMDQIVRDIQEEKKNGAGSRETTQAGTGENVRDS